MLVEIIENDIVISHFGNVYKCSCTEKFSVNLNRSDDYVELTITEDNTGKVVLYIRNSELCLINNK